MPIRREPRAEATLKHAEALSFLPSLFDQIHSLCSLRHESVIAKLDWISIAGAAKLGRILDVCVNKVRRKSAFGSLTHGNREGIYAEWF